MNQLTAGLIVVIGILGGFYVGARYGMGHPPPSTTVSSSTGTGATFGAGAGAGAGNRTGAGGGGFGGAGGAGGAGATSGTITAVNGTTITIHDARTNQDVKVDIASARISKTTDGTPADLTQNQTVTVVGQAGSDGTVTATVVSIGTAAFGGGRRGAASPTPSPST